MSTSIDTNPELSAREAGLRYVDPSRPGISRHRAGKGFFYRDAKQERITDQAVRERISGLVIPPAWSDVWICPNPSGHIQVTGYDARKRKQYIYHERWRTYRDETKFYRLIHFAEALPGIRQEIDRQLRRQGLPREKIVAAVVSLLEKTLIRVGNESYARENKSFGLTTLRDRHARVHGETITFNFRGKAGVEHAIDLEDARLARIVKRTQDLPGQELMQYLDDDGKHVPVTSDDVNQFLRNITGEDFSAKDFRTWAGTVLAASELSAFEPPMSVKSSNQDIVTAIDAVAKQLGNTRSICRSCYVHPDVLEAYLEKEVISVDQAIELNPADSPLGSLELSSYELAVLAFLKKRASSTEADKS